MKVVSIVGGVPGIYTWDGKYGFEKTEGDPESVVYPGFVDIHIHGSMRQDFMSMTSPTQVDAWAKSLALLGYEYFYPTTITSDAATLRRVIENIPDHPMIPGFHLEGPFISPEYPGAQPPQYILDPADRGTEWDWILEHPKLKLITLAPERPGALELIRELTSRGVRVSMGHTNATYAEADAAWEAGARHMTHTFNAMRPFHHREAGVVGFGLTSRAYKELIYDRKHVCKDSARTIAGGSTLLGVSDATMAAGMPPNERFTMWGLDVVTGEDEVRLASNGSLAGSAVTLDVVFENLWEDFDLVVAAQACCVNPRQAMGLPESPQVLLHLSLDGELLEIINSPA